MSSPKKIDPIVAALRARLKESGGAVSFTPEEIAGIAREAIDPDRADELMSDAADGDDAALAAVVDLMDGRPAAEKKRLIGKI